MNLCKPSGGFLSTAVTILFVFLMSGCNTGIDSIDQIIEPIFALNCPGKTAHFDKVDTFLVFGHRGSPIKEVENTIPAFEQAMVDGANALEIDLCMTSDGVIVVWHDWNPNDGISLVRESGGESGLKCRPRFPPLKDPLRVPIDEITLDQFRANYYYVTQNLLDKERVPAEIPTFEQFLQWGAARPGLRYVALDLKLPNDKSHLAETYHRKIDSLIDLYHPTWEPVYMTPNENVWNYFTRAVEGAGLTFDVDLGGGLVDATCDVSSSNRARTRGSGFTSTMHPFVWTERPWATLMRLLTCDLEARDTPVESGKPKLVEKVIAATIDAEEKMVCLIELGVDGLLTNKPEVLRAEAAKLGKKF